jgi:GGDEF domain-containing protein
MAERIRGITRGIDTSARFGGDVFVKLLSEYATSGIGSSAS